MSNYTQPLPLFKITGVAAAAQGTFANTNLIERLTVIISGLTSETVTVTGDIGGGVFTGNLRPIDLTTGAVTAASTLANGSYLFKECAYANIKFTKSSTSETPTITVTSRG